MQRVWEHGKCVKDFDCSPQCKRPLGRSKHRWEDGIEVDLRETWLGVVIGFILVMMEPGGSLLSTW
jgi:hypothetical protein